MAIVYGTSCRGKQTIIFRNYEYLKECDNVCGTTSWRCRQYVAFKCKARLVTEGGRLIRETQPEHTHAGNVATALARKAVGDMKDAMGDLMATPSASQAAVSAGLNDQVLMALPRRSTLSRTLQRRRKQIIAAGNGGVALPAAPTNLDFAIPEEFLEMVLYDSGPGDNRIIVMGCLELLDGLARADVWLADGTFSVVPTIFFQLYSIHFVFGSGVCPAAVYCLLPNKTAETYARVIHELQRLIPRASPNKVLVDFERAAMNTFAAAYPNAVVTGCYFHLCQSVVRKVNEVGLKVVYENDNAVREYIRCLPALAFVPVEDVVDAFEILAETMPEDVEHVAEVTSFFEHTYVRGRRQRGRAATYGAALFPAEKWNQHAAGTDGISRTTNAVEGWHHGLQSLFLCHHPTCWTFLAGLMKDMQKQKTVFLQGVAGVERPATKKYRQLNDRVRRTVAAYGRAEVLVFLRSIAYLSHT